MKKTVAFRFSEQTLARLEALAEGSTRTAVLERLIEGASTDGFAAVSVADVRAAKHSAAELAKSALKKQPTVHRQPIQKPGWKK